MIARIRKSMEEKAQGFTLIELLVVMVIIGILSAIAVPVFLSQRSKAYDTASRSDVANIGREVATYYVDNSGTSLGIGLDGSTANSWALTGVPAGIAVPKGRLSSTTGTPTGAFTDTTWCVTVTNSKTSNSFAYKSTVGLVPGTSTCS